MDFEDILKLLSKKAESSYYELEYHKSKVELYKKLIETTEKEIEIIKKLIQSNETIKNHLDKM